MRDLFISHASEDKDELVRPLAIELQKEGFSVWYDEFELTIGDSLSDIDMFRTSGLTVAVENAVDGLKNKAQHVVAKNIDFGFAQAVYELAMKS